MNWTGHTLFIRNPEITLYLDLSVSDAQDWNKPQKVLTTLGIDWKKKWEPSEERYTALDSWFEKLDKPLIASVLVSKGATSKNSCLGIELSWTYLKRLLLLIRMSLLHPVPLSLVMSRLEKGHQFGMDLYWEVKEPISSIRYEFPKYLVSMNFLIVMLYGYVLICLFEFIYSHKTFWECLWHVYTYLCSLGQLMKIAYTYFVPNYKTPFKLSYVFITLFYFFYFSIFKYIPYYCH